MTVGTYKLGQTDGGTDRWEDDQMSINRQTDGRTNGRTDGWTDGQTDGWMDG